jgi:outer membrane protein
MKRVIVAFIILISFSSCQQNQQKIGFVDRSEVINKYQAKIDLEEKYKGKNEVYIKRRDSLIQRYEFDRKDASIRAQRMSQKELEKLGQEFQQREALLGQQIQFEKEEIEKAFTTEMDTLISEVKKFVTKYGETNGYSFILGTSDATNSVMYGPEENDISKEILKGLNDSYKNTKDD